MTHFSWPIAIVGFVLYLVFSNLIAIHKLKDRVTSLEQDVADSKTSSMLDIDE